MKASVPVYAFDDGWSVVRMGTDEWPLDRRMSRVEPVHAFFALKDPAATTHSVLRTYAHPDSVSVMAQDPPQDPEHYLASSGLMQRYWRSFVAEMVREPGPWWPLKWAIGFPDQIFDRLEAPDLEAEIEQVWAEWRADWMKRLGPGQDQKTGHFDSPQYFEMTKKFQALIDRIFGGIEGVDIAYFVEETELRAAIDGPAMFEHIDISYDTYIEFEEPSWRYRTDETEEEFVSLAGLWKAYTGDPSGCPMIRESRVDAWWDTNTVAGTPLVDQEAYWLVNSKLMPIVRDDAYFEAWYRAQQDGGP